MKKVFILIIFLCTAPLFVGWFARFTQPSYVPVKWINLREIEIAVFKFSKAYGRYPTSSEGLEVLVRRPEGWAEKERWQAFLDKSVLVDGWGNPFGYRLNPPGNEYGIYSCGEDGVSHSHGEDPDDVNNWIIGGTNRGFVRPEKDTYGW